MAEWRRIKNTARPSAVSRTSITVAAGAVSTARTARRSTRS
ncbi:hypothetical protein I552_4691 [Mycobacterium xenopi 3993]|nr:hypothetical protein I552_4691 [Mycobacterium xenopi 3993]